MILLARHCVLALAIGCLTFATLAQEEPPEEEGIVTLDDGEDAEAEARKDKSEDRNAGDPCRIANTIQDAWIDRLQSSVQAAVCNSAVWFDHFFGKGEAVDSEQFFGYVGVGVLYKTAGEWEDVSRFDANVPMPNLNKRLNLFVGRGDEDQIIQDSSSSVAEPVAAFQEEAGTDWLAGFGYSPPGRRGQRWNFRVGGKVSSDPYAFGQARWRLNYFPSDKRAIRVRQTFFYRTNDDGFGSTTAAGFDWFMKANLMGRASGSVTISQDERGVDWKTFLTLYQDFSKKWGKARGAAYQYFIRGYTEGDVTVPEYGVRATYRQQMFRPYLIGEAIVGYSWDKDDEDGTIAHPARVGSWNVGFVLELRFGTRPKVDTD